MLQSLLEALEQGTKRLPFPVTVVEQRGIVSLNKNTPAQKVQPFSRSMPKDTFQKECCRTGVKPISQQISMQGHNPSRSASVVVISPYLQQSL